MPKLTKTTYLTAGRLRELEARLRPFDRDVLALLDRLDYATTNQVERVLFTEGTPLACARAARRTLRRLVDEGLLHRLDRRIGGLGAGSAQHVFTLDRAALRLLSLRGDRDGVRVRRPEERGLAFLTHTLALAEHYVALVELLRPLPDSELLTWLGEPDCHRPFSAGGQPFRLTPDAFVEVRRGEEAISSFLEVDRGTEARTTLARKAALYLRYARLHPGESPQVVFSFPSSSRSSFFPSLLPDLAHREGASTALAERLFRVGPFSEAVRALAGEEDAASSGGREPPEEEAEGSGSSARRSTGRSDLVGVARGHLNNDRRRSAS